MDFSLGQVLERFITWVLGRIFTQELLVGVWDIFSLSSVDGKRFTPWYLLWFSKGLSFRF
jgi:hypothetical protein